jgi:hypothetical protein
MTGQRAAADTQSQHMSDALTEARAANQASLQIARDAAIVSQQSADAAKRMSAMTNRPKLVVRSTNHH